MADYNYIFAPGVSIRQLDDLENTILLVDEAHNLPDRARQIFSPELLQHNFRIAVEQLPALTPGNGGLPTPRTKQSASPKFSRALETILPLLGGEGRGA